MKTLRFFLLQIAILTFSAIVAQDMPYKKEVKDGKEFYLYQVETGEGIFAVCRKFNVTQEEILRYNKDIEDGLRNGQVLRIPTKKMPTKVDESAYFYHTIDQGETLNSIATMYGVSASSIRKLNADADKNIKVGFALKIPQTIKPRESNLTENFQYHTISPRETLFSVAQKYGVSMQEIMNSNPGLTGNTFLVGKVIRVDLSKSKKSDAKIDASESQKEDSYIQYVIRNNESLLSISRKFNISVESLVQLNPQLKNGVKPSLSIRVPMPKTPVIEPEKDINQSGTNNETPDDETPTVINSETLKVALMLPFMVDETGEEAAKQSRRFIEFYEGLLLSIEKLKNEGISIDLHVYDTGGETKSVSKILRLPDLANMDLIIGPVYNDHIAPISRFAKDKNIPMVIPFTSKNEDVLTNPNLIQINTPHSYIYSGAAQLFSKRFKNSQIIFLDEANKSGDKNDFISVLKTELKRRSIPFKSFATNETDGYESITSILSPTQENILVPTSGSLSDLQKIVPSLQSVAMTNPSFNICLFGYPEWQTYVKDYLEAFHYLNTYIYSPFFANPTSNEYKDFAIQFRSWYQRDMINSYPRYGILGFDTGNYFLKALATTGNNFDKNVFKKSFHGVQTGFSLERVNYWGGLINKNVYLINYGRNFEITKLISDK
ncbi:MAG: LysM peptidoglycan-binding domain-containing protein [Bacteroidales bacterium]|nr:LysM peptidoglycan-binding domain-containing protein [Bacteroidales bacterium]